MANLEFLDQIHHGQIRRLLGVEELSQVDLREEISPEKLEEALRNLSKRDCPYTQIHFEQPGWVHIQSFRMDYRLPFDMVALSYERKHIFTEFLTLQTIGSIQGSPPIHVRNPQYFRNNIRHKRDPTKEEENRLRFNFGRFLSRIELVVNADWNLEAEEAQETEGDRLYKLPSAYGYRIKR